MSNKKKTFRQFLENINTIGHSVKPYAEVVFASRCFYASHTHYVKMALKQGYIKRHGGIWIVTPEGDDFIRQLRRDYS